MYQQDNSKQNEDKKIRTDVLQKGHLLRDRYRIETFLEVKKGANIYRATDEVTNFIVILKEKLELSTLPRTTSIHTGDKNNSNLRANPWYDEFAILRSVTYPTVVKAVDIFTENDKYYLVIEQLEGNDLRYYLTKNKVSIQQSCDWLIQLCQSLSQLHRRQLVHLDLQTRYIVVTKDLQRVRLTGFDSAWELPVKKLNPENLSVYSAPELRQGTENIDSRADIYSLGAIWHEMLTGYKPTPEDLEDKWFTFPEIVEFNPQINPQINRIVSKMLKFEPENRYNSIDELKIAILELYSSILYSVGYCTDVGMERDANEDSFSVQNKRYISQNRQLNYGIFIVADGMGGAKAGEHASALATQEVSSYINHYFEDLNTKRFQDSELLELMEQAVKRANSIIYQQSKENKEFSGMGTTITASLVYEGQLFISHVGDSRAYIINNSGIEKVSRDHSLVGRLLEIGQITPEEAAVHPQRNLIYRSLGGFPAVEVETYQLPMRSNDYLLLCTDGLYEYVKDEEMQSIVLSCKEAGEACRNLVNLANIRGGDDNSTVVIVRIEEIS
ncbi:MAG: Stp1/IreP family PP2C-type Ser/Thr phosphatase [Candidatus Sericytochromatia bacterium]